MTASAQEGVSRHQTATAGHQSLWSMLRKREYRRPILLSAVSLLSMGLALECLIELGKAWAPEVRAFLNPYAVNWDWPWDLFLAFFLLLLVFTWAFLNAVRQVRVLIGGARATISDQPEPGCSALILCLSRTDNARLAVDQADILMRRYANVSERLDAACKVNGLFEGVNWVQAVRVIRKMIDFDANPPRFPEVRVILSSDNDKAEKESDKKSSHQQWNSFQKMMEHLFQGLPGGFTEQALGRITKVQTIDFESFDQVFIRAVQF